MNFNQFNLDPRQFLLHGLLGGGVDHFQLDLSSLRVPHNQHCRSEKLILYTQNSALHTQKVSHTLSVP